MTASRFFITNRHTGVDLAHDFATAWEAAYYMSKLERADDYAITRRELRIVAKGRRS